MSKKEYIKKETILKLENVSLSFGENKILRDINIEIKDIVRPDVKQGQIISILGPSGLGKTVLFNMMSGLLEPSSGTILIGEKQEATKTGMVGVVQQSYPLFNHRTVEKNLELALKNSYSSKLKVFSKEWINNILRLNKDVRATHKQQIQEILELFELTERRNMYPQKLSGGQKQRVAIAQQILCSNNFLLMDEPYSSLDLNMIKKASAQIVKVANMHEQNTIIIVSHDIVSTAAISDTLLIIGRDKDENGNIIPGATIKYQFDLAAMGLAWDPDIRTKPEFFELIKQIEAIFPTL
jgi:ABC-type nitrate/sulfonate/bicarbonate transport system ATPase subunit